MILPGLARWLDSDTPLLNRSIVVRGQVDIGLVEKPLGSNRNVVFDGYAKRFGSPLGSPYCALSAGAWVADAGGRVPDKDVGAVASWYEMGKARGTLTQQLRAGYLVIYAFGAPGVPDHIGIVAVDDPLALSIEANTTFKRQVGTQRNGWGTDLGEIDVPHVLTYLVPEPAP